MDTERRSRSSVAPAAMAQKGLLPSRFAEIARRVVVRAPIYVILLTLSLLFVTPLFWMVSTSFKPEIEVYTWPPALLPSRIQWETYPYCFENFPFLRGFVNTMAIVVGVMMGRLLSGSLAAYAFARVRFPFRDALFVLVLSTMMIPFHVLLIPQYLLFRNLGWLDTLAPLIVPSWLGGGAFYIFLLRQFFRTIPIEMDDAAR